MMFLAIWPWFYDLGRILYTDMPIIKTANAAALKNAGIDAIDQADLKAGVLAFDTDTSGIYGNTQNGYGKIEYVFAAGDSTTGMYGLAQYLGLNPNPTDLVPIGNSSVAGPVTYTFYVDNSASPPYATDTLSVPIKLWYYFIPSGTITIHETDTVEIQ